MFLFFPIFLHVEIFITIEPKGRGRNKSDCGA